MAFNFLGTMTSDELQNLRSFLRAEVENTNHHINALIAEVDDLKKTQADLESADKEFNGNALTEMQANVIIKDKQRHDDINPAILTTQIKEPFISNIKYKRERIEYKIKKITDTIEQKYKERDFRVIAQTETTELLNALSSLFTDANNKSLFRSPQKKVDAEDTNKDE